MNRSIALALTLSTLMLAGCSSPMEVANRVHAFGDTQVNARTYLVRYDAAQSPDLAEQLLLLHAAELTLAKGFRVFTVSGQGSRTSHESVTLPAQTVTTGQVVANPYVPGAANYTQTTSTVGGGTIDFSQAHERMTVTLFTEAEAHAAIPPVATVYDAPLLVSQLRPRLSSRP